jgi:NAD-dependent DNA ligase
MNGKICFAIQDKNVEIVVENSKIVEHKIETVEKENQFTKISYFNSDGSDMTDTEYDQFYDENTELIELLADLEVLF